MHGGGLFDRENRCQINKFEAGYRPGETLIRKQEFN